MNVTCFGFCIVWPSATLLRHITQNCNADKISFYSNFLIGMTLRYDSKDLPNINVNYGPACSSQENIHCNLIQSLS